jgi:hypothetical protein
MNMNARSWQPLAGTILTLILIGGTALVLARLQQFQQLGVPGLRMVAEPVFSEDGEVINTNTVALPHRVLHYESRSVPISNIELSWLPPDTTYARRLYEGPDGFGILTSVVLMGYDRTSIHRPQICLDGQGWTIEESDLLDIQVHRPHPYRLPVMRLVASRPFQDNAGQSVSMKAVYVYWFVADGQITARHGERMWWMARDLLRKGVLQRWAYVSCLAVGPPGTESLMYERIEQFITASVPDFQIATRPPEAGVDLALSTPVSPSR